ncbi:MAG: hypothetical protein WCF23_19400 [Candidatus Nitrosopolaris sp.]
MWERRGGDCDCGGNSAGQAAVFLAQTTKRVHMLVRSSGLVASIFNSQD